MGCKMNPIVGNRFKCIMCENFNYCENWEKQLKDEHKNKQLKNKDLHIFNKIEKPVVKSNDSCILF